MPKRKPKVAEESEEEESEEETSVDGSNSEHCDSSSNDDQQPSDEEVESEDGDTGDSNASSDDNEDASSESEEEDEEGSSEGEEDEEGGKERPGTAKAKVQKEVVIPPEPGKEPVLVENDNDISDGDYDETYKPSIEHLKNESVSSNYGEECGKFEQSLREKLGTPVASASCNSFQDEIVDIAQLTENFDQPANSAKGATRRQLDQFSFYYEEEFVTTDKTSEEESISTTSIKPKMLRFEDFTKVMLSKIVVFGTLVEHVPTEYARKIAPLPVKQEKVKVLKTKKERSHKKRKVATVAMVAEPMSREDAFKRAVEFRHLPANALPLKLNSITVLILGQIKSGDNKAFYKSDTLWPIGFTSIRSFVNIRDPLKKANYTSLILEGESGPLFRVTLPKREGVDGEEDLVFEAQSASRVWLTILKAVNVSRKKVGIPEAGTAISGPEMYGLANPVVKQLLEGLPNVLDCKDYVFMTNRANKKVQKKSRKSSRKTKSPQATEKTQPSLTNFFKQKSPKTKKSVSERLSVLMNLSTNKMVDDNSIYVIIKTINRLQKALDNDIKNDTLVFKPHVASVLSALSALKSSHNHDADVMVCVKTLTNSIATDLPNGTSKMLTSPENSSAMGKGFAVPIQKPEAVTLSLADIPNYENGPGVVVGGNCAQSNMSVEVPAPREPRELSLATAYSDISTLKKSCKTLQKLRKLTKKEDDRSDAAKNKIIKILREFLTLRVTKKIVKKSGLGETIGKLVKHSIPAIQEAADLVKKCMVEQLDREESESMPCNPSSAMHIVPIDAGKHAKQNPGTLEMIAKSDTPLPENVGQEQQLPKEEVLPKFDVTTLQRIRVVIRGIQKWQILMEYDNPSLVIHADDGAVYTLLAPKGMVSLQPSAAYMPTFLSFYRKFRTVCGIVLQLQEMLPFLNSKKTKYIRIVDAVKESMGSLIDESYIHRHCHFILEQIKCADEEESFVRKLLPASVRMSLPVNRFQKSDFAVQLSKRGPGIIKRHNTMKYKQALKEWKKVCVTWNRYTRRRDKIAVLRKKKESTTLVNDMELFHAETEYNAYTNIRDKEASGTKSENDCVDVIRLPQFFVDNNINPSNTIRPDWPIPNNSILFGVEMDIVQPVIQMLYVADRFPRVFSYNWRKDFASVFGAIKAIGAGPEILGYNASKFIGKNVLSDLHVRIARAVLKGKENAWQAMSDEELETMDPDVPVEVSSIRNVLQGKTVGSMWQEAIRRTIIALSATPVPIGIHAVNHDGMDLSRRVLYRVMTQVQARGFCSPLNVEALGLVDYDKIVPKRMDFGTILAKIDSGEYTALGKDPSTPCLKRSLSISMSPEDENSFCIPLACQLIFQDSRLVWENCIKYWTKVDPGEPIIEDAKLLRDFFMDEWSSTVVQKLTQQHQISSIKIDSHSGTTDQACLTWPLNSESIREYYDDRYNDRLGCAVSALACQEYEDISPVLKGVILNFLVEELLSLPLIHEDIEYCTARVKHLKAKHKENLADIKSKLAKKRETDKEREEVAKAKQAERDRLDAEYARRLARGLSRRATRNQRVNYAEMGNEIEEEVEIPSIEELELQHAKELMRLEDRAHPLGQDKFGNLYLSLPTYFSNDTKSSDASLLIVQHSKTGAWFYYESVEEFEQLKACLHPRGFLESALKLKLEKHADSIVRGFGVYNDLRRLTANECVNGAKPGVLGFFSKRDECVRLLLEIGNHKKRPVVDSNNQAWTSWSSRVDTVSGMLDVGPTLTSLVKLTLEMEGLLFADKCTTWGAAHHERNIWTYSSSNAKTFSYLMMKIADLKDWLKF